MGPRWLPWGTPDVTLRVSEKWFLKMTFWNLSDTNLYILEVWDLNLLDVALSERDNDLLYPKLY